MTRCERKRSRSLVLLLGALHLIAIGAPAFASNVRIFRLQTQAEFLKGTLDGIGVDSLGTLRLADRAERLVEVGEPFVLSAAEHPDGWVIGTGNAGKVLLIDRSGNVETIHTAVEPEIFAVWVDPDGTVYAGSSPNGKVYRIRDKEASVFFDPEEIYIWDLARSAGGELLVATGTDGKLFSVTSEGEGDVIFDSEDTHIRALETRSDGSILVGTAGEGLILELGPSGQPRTVYDAPYPEVVAFATDPNDNLYAALLASESSLVTLDRQPAKDSSSSENDGAEDRSENDIESTGQVSVTMTDPSQVSAVGTRPPGFKGSRSEIVKISPRGSIETLTTFQEETVYSLHWSRNRLWVGTGLDGKIFSLSDHRPVLEVDVDERQVVKILADDDGPAFATTNASALYRLSRDPVRAGRYTSPALDSGQIARFGTLRWHGSVPGDSHLSFSVRSGMSSSPDRTWTDWSAAQGGREISLGSLATGRYVQWRAFFEATRGQSPTLTEVTLSYAQENLPPIIVSFAALEPGQILVPANFNASQQVFESASPNRQGIFDTLVPTTPPKDSQRLKTLWRQGYRTLQWKAEDPNDDALRFEILFRSEDSEGDWMPVVEDLDESYYSFDSTSLPDGRYRFQLVAVDRSRGDDLELKRSEEISEPVVVDHSVPNVVAVDRRGASIEVQVEDSWNPIRMAEYSVDAAEWEPAPTKDGLLDGQRETLVLRIPESGRLMLLKVQDAAFNVITIDVSEKLQ